MYGSNTAHCREENEPNQYTDFYYHFPNRTSYFQEIHVTEDTRMEVTGRRGRSKQLLTDLKETRGYWKFEVETIDHTVWGIRFRRGYGPDLSQRNE
jgi:hypothetical protein